MKRLDIIYYLFIFVSMALSAIYAPVMFIEHKALAGWLWILVFVFFLLLLLYGTIKTRGEAQESWLAIIIGGICVIGQWTFIIAGYTKNESGFFVAIILGCLGMLSFIVSISEHPKRS